MRVLVLGGTVEARQVSAALLEQGLEVTLALKGLTGCPLIPRGVCHREGGFGGIEGLAATLKAYDLLIDATHPFARRMSWNAFYAARLATKPCFVVQRPPWKRQPGDRWQDFTDLSRAASRLRHLPSKRVLLALGGQGAEQFCGLPQHELIVRVLARSKTALATRYGVRWRRLRLQRFDRSPTLTEEQASLKHVDLLILRNAGGLLGVKLTAARRLHKPVWIIARPAMPPVPIYGSVAALLDAIAQI